MKRFLICTYLFLFASFAYAQRMDVGVWASVSVEQKFFKNKQLALGGSFNFRMDEKSSMVSSYFPEIYLGYKFLNIFSIQADYRLALKRASFGGFTPKNRI